MPGVLLQATERFAFRRGGSRQLSFAQQFIILSMRTDPEPDNTVLAGRINTQGSMVDSGSYRPESTCLFQVQRWVTRVFFEKIEIPVRNDSDLDGQPVACLPIFRRGVMFHSSLQAPALKSANASFAKSSSSPFCASSSNSLSHFLWSREENQSRNLLKSFWDRLVTTLSISVNVVIMRLVPFAELFGLPIVSLYLKKGQSEFQGIR